MMGKGLMMATPLYDLALATTSSTSNEVVIYPFWDPKLVPGMNQVY